MPGRDVLDLLLAGNERFRSGQGTSFRYEQEDLARIAKVQKPIAAVVTCADSRLTPEVIFDQPLGSLFVSRVPGNVASDSAKWMIDIAVLEFKVPLLIVLGHTGCLAVGQVASGQVEGTGGSLRLRVLKAVMRAKAYAKGDLDVAAVKENAKLTVEDLVEESSALREALRRKEITCVPAIYEMESGRVTTDLAFLNP